MSSPQDDGGRAFPTQGYDSPNHGWIYGSDGMYLRDYFAAAALQGLLANNAMIDTTTPYSAEWAAEFSHQCADAMLAARKEKA